MQHNSKVFSEVYEQYISESQLIFAPDIRLTAVPLNPCAENGPVIGNSLLHLFHVTSIVSGGAWKCREEYLQQHKTEIAAR